ncbi:MAG: PEP-CTERM sorting domain-containing protein [Acidobacteria bacterium]|nr:PEP-CTERM sorting domain-containing protein [Acidobacteriota bacterium]
MRSYKCWAVMIAIMVLAPVAAKADAIHVDTFVVSLGNYSPAAELAYLENRLGIDDLVYLAKAEDDGWEYGVSGLEGDFGTDAVDENSGNVWWDLTGSDYALRYILLKGGKYKVLGEGILYALYSVTDDQYQASGWPQEVGFLFSDESGNPFYINKGISHISFFGSYDFTTVPPPSQVPEPSTLLLIGTGVLGLGIFGRRKFQK